MAIDQLPESIETARLLVRVARPGDGPMFNEAIVESCEDLKHWLGWVYPPPSVDESEASCRRAYARFLLNEDLMALFIHKESGHLVGGSGLHNANWKLRQFEVGYWAGLAIEARALSLKGWSRWRSTPSTSSRRRGSISPRTKRMSQAAVLLSGPDSNWRARFATRGSICRASSETPVFTRASSKGLFFTWPTTIQE